MVWNKSEWQNRGWSQFIIIELKHLLAILLEWNEFSFSSPISSHFLPAFFLSSSLFSHSKVLSLTVGSQSSFPYSLPVFFCVFHPLGNVFCHLGNTSRWFPVARIIPAFPGDCSGLLNTLPGTSQTFGNHLRSVPESPCNVRERSIVAPGFPMAIPNVPIINSCSSGVLDLTISNKFLFSILINHIILIV